MLTCPSDKTTNRSRFSSPRRGGEVGKEVASDGPVCNRHGGLSGQQRRKHSCPSGWHGPRRSCLAEVACPLQEKWPARRRAKRWAAGIRKQQQTHAGVQSLKSNGGRGQILNLPGSQQSQECVGRQRLRDGFWWLLVSCLLRTAAPMLSV